MQSNGEPFPFHILVFPAAGHVLYTLFMTYPLLNSICG